MSASPIRPSTRQLLATVGLRERSKTSSVQSERLARSLQPRRLLELRFTTLSSRSVTLYVRCIALKGEIQSSCEHT